MSERITQIIPVPGAWKAVYLHGDSEYEREETERIACLALTEGGDVRAVVLAGDGDWYYPHEQENFCLIVDEDGQGVTSPTGANRSYPASTGRPSSRSLARR